ncbi:hypothetical protein K440DRAFT_131710 [Wilcoxina mikolae CBS 423.85]|nr:hypothetical protein K440DRAFT_131710 [Wilcoxina mikolae CBS 423.85]
MFASSLLGMNINLLENNPAWWWYFLVSGVVLFLVLLGWTIFKYLKFEEFLECKVEGLSAKVQRLRRGRGNTDEDVEMGKMKTV